MKKRISDEVFNKTNSLEELVQIMGTTKDGHKLSEVGDYKDFIRRLDSFKEVIARELPELTIEEILKFDSMFSKVKDIIYEWYGFNYLLTALEFEQRKKNKK